MIERLSALLSKVPISIITAAGWPRIEEQFLKPLSPSADIVRFFIFPNSSAQCYDWKNGAWTMEYNLSLSEDERAKVRAAINATLAEEDFTDPGFQPLIIDREAQIALAAIGLDAPFEQKKNWDPDQSKRKRLKAAIEKRVPDVEVLIGGMTTIDITKKGVNKSYGVRWLSGHLNIPIADMLYVGDALYPGGNDEVVIPTGVQTRATSGPLETEKIIDELLEQNRTKDGIMIH
jgi:hydroxymethylpyrimidine pyrophosphatase-like HAD family hydrolase